MYKRNGILFVLLFVALFLHACSKEDSTMTFTPINPDPEPNQDLTYLALGDSYTIGQSVDENERWPVQLVQALYEQSVNITGAKIIAQTGWTTAELQKGIAIEDPQGPFSLVTLLIGVNNQYRNLDTAIFRQEFRELLEQSIGFSGNDAGRVIVVSIPDYGVTPFAVNMDPEKIAREIDAYNTIKLAEANRAGVAFVDVTTISRQAAQDDSLIASDGLHPSGKMYAKWVEVILPVAEAIVKEP